VFADQRLQLEHDAHARADRVSRQVWKARWAAATAASTSSAVANGTRASTCWVAGLTMSRHSVVLDSTHWPSISSLTCSTLVWLGLRCVHLRLLGIIVGTKTPRRGGHGVACGAVFEYRCANIQQERTKNRIIMQKDLTSLSALNWDDLKFFPEVARTRKASSAAKRLAVDYTTVSRRISSLEGALGTLLFEKSRTNGFVLTAEGQRLLGYAESIESTLHMACEQVSGSGVALSGHVRMGCTEGFGSFFITPQLSHFVDAYPAISVDILPLPHFISLSKREADIVIALERPEHGPYVCCKLCDYRLRLYATQDYLDSHAPIRRWRPGEHPFISYVDDLAFSSELLYLANLIPNASAHLRSTSVIAQYTAALQGRGLAILPCFLAAQDPRLVTVLPEEIEVTRQFWMYCREDLRKLKRITLLWDYIREVTEANAPLLMGRRGR
jgi:DNA-binding transcriptional LysR family regulator